MKWLVLFLFILSSLSVYAGCSEVPEDRIIGESMTLCSGTYFVPEGVKIAKSGVVLDCAGGILRGEGGLFGIRAENVVGISILNCNIVTFSAGVAFKNVSFSAVSDSVLVKNDVGLRLENSFENVFSNNADKSLQSPVFVLESAFNTFHFENKQLDGFECIRNLCNEVGVKSPCENGDGYCSKKCAGQDDDCVVVSTPTAMSSRDVQAKYRDAEQVVDALAASAKTSVSFSEIKGKSFSQWVVLGVLFVVAFGVVGVAVRVALRSPQG